MELTALTVEVVYALPREQAAVTLGVPPGTTLRQAVERSGLLARYPEIDPMTLRVGVFGGERRPEEPVRAFDRIEIYRPLPADPKEMRRRRAAKTTEWRNPPAPARSGR